MRVSNIMAGIACILWAGMLKVGTSLMKGVAGQHVAGYPNSAQLFHYIWIPVIVIIALLVSALASNIIRRSFSPLQYLAAGSMVFLLFFFVMSGGGV